MSLFRLIYTSKNRIEGDDGARSAAIDAILAASRRNNEAAGVSGALMFNSGVFAQVLEGDRATVETTFERIQRDPRHGNVQVLAFEATSARIFPSWSMGFIGRSQQQLAMFGHIAAATDFRPDRLAADRVLSTMQRLALDEEPDAS